MRPQEHHLWRALLRTPPRLLVVLAPVALLLAAWWLPRVDANARLGIQAGRQEALATARQLAVTMGLPEVLGEGATAVVKRSEESSTERARFLAAHAAEAPEAVALVDRLAPPLAASVTLRSPNGDQLRVTVAPTGEVLGYQLQRNPREPSILRAVTVDPQKVAREALRARWGQAVFDRLDLSRPDGEAAVRDAAPEGEDASEDTAPPASPAGAAGAGPRTTSVRWTRPLEGLPGLTLQFQVQVRDGIVLEEAVTASLDDDAEGTLDRGGGLALLILAWVAASILAIFAFAYGLWRYVDRLQESEVSHGRTALLGAGVGVLACLALYSFAVTNAGGLEESGIGLSLPIFLGVVFTIFFFVGLLLGVVWAGCEGDVREVYGAKLISLDALFAGRLLSANLARAVLAALAVGAWVMLARVMVLLPWSAMAEAGPRLVVMQFYMLHPWQHAASKAFAFLVLFAPLGVLVPLSVMRRWTRSRVRTAPMLAVLSWGAFWINPATALFTLPNFAGMAEAAAWAAGFVVAFLVFDLLTALLSHVAALGMLHGLYFLHQPSASLLREAALGAGVLVAVVAVAAFLRWWGSELTAEEVRPGYARNMLERVSLSAELSAAREAQGRMLPQKPPRVPGATLTSCCAPEWEAEGDYFDFFPLPEHRVGVAVADFGRAGLAAALRMTLAKGFLLSYSWQELAPVEVVGRLLRRLGDLVAGDGEEEVAIAYGHFDPVRSRLLLARAPRSPLVALLPAAGGEPRLLAGAEAPADRPRDAAATVVDLAPGDRLVFANAEGVDWGAAKDRERDRWIDVLRDVRIRSAEELLRLVRNRGLTVGTVLVLVAEDDPAVRGRSPEAATVDGTSGAEAAA